MPVSNEHRKLIEAELVKVRSILAELTPGTDESLGLARGIELLELVVEQSLAACRDADDALSGHTE